MRYDSQHVLDYWITDLMTIKSSWH